MKQVAIDVIMIAGFSQGLAAGELMRVQHVFFDSSQNEDISQV